MKKIIPIPVYVFIVLCTLFVASCSEDSPVTPIEEGPYQFDSARYEWKEDTLLGYSSPIRLSSIDTNDIYFLDLYRTLIHYDGQIFTTESLPFSVLGTSLKAFKDKIYIGGLYINSFDRPALLVKERNMISQIQIPDSNQSYSINSIERTLNNDLWLGTDNGKLIYYNGDNFKFFQFDSIYYDDVFKDINENIYTINRIVINDSLGTSGSKYIEINKFENGIFRRLYYKYFDVLDKHTLSTNIFSGEVFAGNQNNIYKFNKNDFNIITEIPKFSPSFVFTGSSEFDILSEGIILPYQFIQTLFHWNGIKWSKEMDINGSRSFGISEKIKNRFIIVEADDLGKTLLIIGTPKKIN